MLVISELLICSGLSRVLHSTPPLILSAQYVWEYGHAQKGTWRFIEGNVAVHIRKHGHAQTRRETQSKLSKIPVNYKTLGTQPQLYAPGIVFDVRWSILT